ncbi:MAG: hypothetical protein PHV04_10315, partial [Clostridia bacterium]|nr:hypothetical protein [Clostridia bacterium]
MDNSANKCVLCGTEVVLSCQKDITPYPKEKAEVSQLNSKFIASMLTIMLAIPNVACFVINMIYFAGVY